MSSPGAAKVVWSKHPAVRGFLHVLGGNALLTVTQGVQFLILARALGPLEFGRLAAASSITALLMPFSGLGSANVMIMRASRDPGVLPVYFGNSLVVMLVSGALLTGVAVAVAHVFLGGEVPLTLMVTLGVSELLASKLIDICWHAAAAREHFHYTSRFMGTQSALRLAFAAIFVWGGWNFTARHWALWALVSNLLSGAWVLFRTLSFVGRPALDLARARRELAQGVSFAIGISAKGFYTDADKLFLARYAGAETVGQYTMAFRVIQIALAPIRALSVTLQTQLFRAGEAGIQGSLRVTFRVLGPLTTVALALAVGFYTCAPLLTFVAGEKYVESVDVLRTLSMLPLFLAAQALLYDTLVSSGYQYVAATTQVMAAALICALCVLLIPSMDWRGAAVASYASQLFLCSALGLAVLRFRRRALIRVGDAHA